jgi:hypothetical protein
LKKKLKGKKYKHKNLTFEMGQTESFDLLNSSNVNSKSKKEANSIYSFDLNGIFRRIGDIETTVSISDTNSNKAFARQVDKSTSSTTQYGEIELIESNKETNYYIDEHSVYNERLIDGPEAEISIKKESQLQQSEELKIDESVDTQSEPFKDHTVEHLHESKKQEIETNSNQLSIQAEEKLELESDEKKDDEELKNVNEIDEINDSPPEL